VLLRQAQQRSKKPKTPSCLRLPPLGSWKLGILYSSPPKTKHRDRSDTIIASAASFPFPDSHGPRSCCSPAPPKKCLPGAVPEGDDRSMMQGRKKNTREMAREHPQPPPLAAAAVAASSKGQAW
jgi:hypothetical protein